MSSLHPAGRPSFVRLRSVASKLAGATIAVIAMAAVVGYLKVSSYQRKVLLDSKVVGASAVTRLFADSCAAAVVFEDDAAILEALSTLGHNDEVEYAAVWAVAPPGQVGRRLGELRRGQEEIITTLPVVVQVQRRSDRVVLVSPIRNHQGSLVAATVVAFSLARENRAIAQSQRTTLVASSAIALGLMSLLMVLARVVVVSPLRKLVIAAKTLEQGDDASEGREVDVDVDVDIRSNDEVGELAHAFRSMATAIGVRERRIRARNRDMRLVLDNVGQGFVTLDMDGNMSDERSRVIDEWFGALDGAPKFWEYLGRVEVLAGEWFELGWEALREDMLPVQLCLDQLPARVHNKGRVFELAYRPITEGERVDKIIVVITDVTVRIERENAERAQREMMSIFRRALSDRTALEEFFVEADALVGAIKASHHGDLTVVRRQVHTLKGNCALFGIEGVAAFCHAWETRMTESIGPVSASDVQALESLWQNVTDMRAQLMSGGASGTDSVQIGSDEYARFIDDLRRRSSYDFLLDAALSWRFEPASRRLGLLAEQVRDLARRLGKAEVDVICEPTALRLPSRQWASFWSAFVHVLRNTVDHGVETSEARTASGKAPRAIIALALLRERDHLAFTVSDDGPGIAWPVIAAKAKAQGLPHLTRADFEEALFTDGISSRTEVTSTSGRGVGLGAVRDLVRGLGGDVTILTEPSRGTTFRFILPLSMLQDEVVLAAVRPRATAQG